MKCIFCLNDIDSQNKSNEHIFHKALGGTWTTDKVCCCCNSRLGTEIDAKLMDHYLVKSIRNKLKLETAHKKLPTPFQHGSLPEDETIKIQFEYDKEGAIVSNEVFTKTNDEVMSPLH